MHAGGCIYSARAPMVICTMKTMGWGLAPAPFRPPCMMHTLYLLKSELYQTSTKVARWENDYSQGFSLPKVMGSNPMSSKLFSTQLVMGCHVAAHVWATWHPFIGPPHATCQHAIVPVTVQSTLQPATCHLFHCHMSPPEECHVTL
jgi:hypothetical protein